MGSRSVYCNKNVMAMLMKADRSIERKRKREGQVEIHHHYEKGKK